MVILTRQELFIKTYFEERAEEVFSNVAALIVVIDIGALMMVADDLRLKETYYEECVFALQSHSPEAKFFVLFHKSDLLPNGHASTSMIKEFETEIKKIALPLLATCHFTSIWDESIYRAWSTIISALLPQQTMIQNELSRFVERCRMVHEVVLYESQTLLTISHWTFGSGTSTNTGSFTNNPKGSRNHHAGDGKRFEKISNILKQVRLTTRRFDASPVSAKLILDGSIGIIIEQASPDCLLLLIAQNITEDSRLEELCTQVNLFKPVLRAIIEADPSLDPHML